MFYTNSPPWSRGGVGTPSRLVAMGRDHHAAAVLVGQDPEDAEELPAVFGVRIARGLKSRQDLCLHPRSPGDGHVLPAIPFRIDLRGGDALAQDTAPAGTSGPAIRESSVVLPLPEPPMTAYTRPASKARETPNAPQGFHLLIRRLVNVSHVTQFKNARSLSSFVIRERSGARSRVRTSPSGPVPAELT